MSDKPHPSKRQKIKHNCSDANNKDIDDIDEVVIVCARCVLIFEGLEDINEYDARIEKLAESEKKVAELEKLLKEEQDKSAALEKLERKHWVALAEKEIEIEEMKKHIQVHIECLKEREKKLFDAEFTAAGYKSQVYSLEKEKEKLCYHIKSHLSSFESLGKILKSAMD